MSVGVEDERVRQGCCSMARRDVTRGIARDYRRGNRMPLVKWVQKYCTGSSGYKVPAGQSQRDDPSRRIVDLPLVVYSELSRLTVQSSLNFPGTWAEFVQRAALLCRSLRAGPLSLLAWLLTLKGAYA